MSGIVAYAGRPEAWKTIVEELGRMKKPRESAGIVTLNNGEFHVKKVLGRPSFLKTVIEEDNVDMSGTIGMGQIRFATHGRPDEEKNVQPHLSANGEIAIVCNGIIENYKELKEELLKDGTIKEDDFKSDTDVEVIAHMVQLYPYKRDLVYALELAMSNVKGMYAVCTMYKEREEIAYICNYNAKPKAFLLTHGTLLV